MGKSEASLERQLVSRIHRLEGQVRSFERVLGTGDHNQAINQLEAIIAAAKASLSFYTKMLINSPEISNEEKQKILARFLD
jgi:DNA-binding FrmR family transcriptional regulator